MADTTKDKIDKVISDFCADHGVRVPRTRPRNESDRIVITGQINIGADSQALKKELEELDEVKKVDLDIVGADFTVFDIVLNE